MGLHDLVSKAKSVLIMTPDLLDSDIVAATVALGDILLASGKEVQVVTNKSFYSKVYYPYLQADLEFNEEVINKVFRAKLPAGPNIDSVRIEAEGDDYVVVATTRNGKFETESIIFEQTKTEFDLVFLMGMNNLSSRKNISWIFEAEGFRSKICLIGTFDSGLNCEYKVTRENCESLSGVVLDFAEEMGLPITAQHATHLAFGLLSAGLNDIEYSKWRGEKIAYLVSLGADTSILEQLIKREANEIYPKWYRGVYANLTVSEFLWCSNVSEPTLTGSLLALLPKSTLIPFMLPKEVKACVVAIRLGKQTHYFVKSNETGIWACDLLAEYGVLGDRRFARCVSFEPYEKVLQNIATKLRVKVILPHLPEGLKTEKSKVSSSRMKVADRVTIPVNEPAVTETNIAPNQQKLDIKRSEEKMEGQFIPPQYTPLPSSEELKET